MSMDVLSSVYRGDYLWPYIVPIQYKPGKPGDGSSQFANVEEKTDSPVDRALCECDRHNWSPHFARARHLKNKEKAYREAMIKVAAERTILENDIIQHPCTDVDQAVTSLYAADYAKRAFPLADYRTMKKDHDDPIVTPVAMIKEPSKTWYRDTTPFKVVAIVPPAINAPRSLSFNLLPPVEDPEDVYATEYASRVSKYGYDNYSKSQRFSGIPKNNLDY